MPSGFISKYLYSRNSRYIFRDLFIDCFLCMMIFLVTQIKYPGRKKWRPVIYELVNPKFSSIDGKGQPYQIQGDKVSIKSDGKYIFTHPWAQLTHQKSQIFKASGNHGFFDKKTQLLHLTGKVSISSQDDHHIQTPQAFMNLKTKDIHSLNPVQGEGPMGLFQARGFFLNKDKLVLKGPVSMTIHNTSDLNLFQDNK